ncbi:MYND finger family protein [Metarhizium rileyi]|uniref:MYND finger family protein n=1 Tax=Metarhizium rileyi (strain RCEF 4871) TaxID=1649241 RepID=A0A166VS11_METRR|nr:MYND finger family protein [Metarhizium rileyi RCEF 4871]
MTAPDEHVEPYLVTKPTCAARDEQGRPCDAAPTVPCPSCLLVAYCGDTCRVRHWGVHKLDCKKTQVFERLGDSLAGEQDDARYYPTFWAGYAATDILNLEKTEGRFFDGELSLLLAGQSPFRHFIYSLLKIPKTATPTLQAHFRIISTPSLYRDFLVMHLLFAQNQDPYLNAEAAIHLMYSAKLPRLLWDHIAKVMGPYFCDLDTTFDELTGHQDSRDSDSCESEIPSHFVWRHDELEFAAVLFGFQWRWLRNIATPKTQMSSEQASIVRALDIENNCEPLRSAASRMTRSRALGMMKWRRDGLLLPFGHPTEAILFRDDGSYPAGASAEPIGEWPMEVLDFGDDLAQNDVYGKMFYYLRDMLVRFQEERKRFTIRIVVASAKLHDVLHDVPEEIFFDRIHMGELWDFHPACNLTIAATYLRHRDENPFATMLAMSRQSVVRGTELEPPGDALGDNLTALASSSAVLDEYAPPTAIGDGCSKAGLRRRIGLLMWHNWDKFSDRFLYNPGLFAFYVSFALTTGNFDSVFKCGFLGLEYKEKNTITRKWPNRLVHSRNDKPTLRDFNRYVGWFDNVPQRWIEWRRVDDYDETQWENARSCVLNLLWSDMIEVQQSVLELNEACKPMVDSMEKALVDAGTCNDGAAMDWLDDDEDLGRRIEELLKDDVGSDEKPGKKETAETKGQKSKRKKGKKK